MLKGLLAWGSVHAFLAVAMGAFGAHALRSRLSPDMAAVYQTATHYHLTHALGLLLVGLLSDRLASRPLVHWSGRLLNAGIFLFSGSLYLLSLSGLRVLGAITPFGGVCFLAGWALLALAALREPEPAPSYEEGASQHYE